MVAIQLLLCEIYQPMPTIHHLTVFCLPLLWSHCTVFAVFHQMRKEPTPYRRCFGPTLTEGVQHAHNTPLRITYNRYMNHGSHELWILSSLRLLGQRGRSPTPPEPLELGSGAQDSILIRKGNNTTCVSTLNVNCGPGFPECIIPPWVGTDAAGKSSISVPEGKVVLPMMRRTFPLK